MCADRKRWGKVVLKTLFRYYAYVVTFRKFTAALWPLGGLVYGGNPMYVAVLMYAIQVAGHWGHLGICLSCVGNKMLFNWRAFTSHETQISLISSSWSMKWMLDFQFNIQVLKRCIRNGTMPIGSTAERRVGSNHCIFLVYPCLNHFLFIGYSSIDSSSKWVPLVYQNTWSLSQTDPCCVVANIWRSMFSKFSSFLTQLTLPVKLCWGPASLKHFAGFL